MAADHLSAAVAARRPLAAGLFDDLARATAAPDGRGVTRASYGEGEQYAHDLVARTAAGLGLEVDTDAAGNTYLTRPGRDRGAPRIVVGSHLDSVDGGGNFDGAAGVVAGLVAAAALDDAGAEVSRDVVVMGIRAEESAWFATSYVGSRAALGTLDPAVLDAARRRDTGRTLAEHMRDLGLDPAALSAGPPRLRRADLDAYLELHIEQGPVLVERGAPVAVVTGIRGNFRVPDGRCLGAYDHCGGPPRRSRQDAVMATVALIGELDAAWREIEAAGGDVAVTVGRCFTDPAHHGVTKIPGRVDFSLDVRSQDPGTLAEMERRLHDRARAIAAERGVRFLLEPLTRAAPGAVDPGIRAELLARAAEIGLDAPEMPSGASHDAAEFAAAGVPTGMIFVRNDGGSHNPDEAMDLDDFLRATDLLAHWLASR